MSKNEVEAVVIGRASPAFCAGETPTSPVYTNRGNMGMEDSRSREDDISKFRYHETSMSREPGCYAGGSKVDSFRWGDDGDDGCASPT